MTRDVIVRSFRLAAWGCMALVATLSLLPAPEMVRTGLGGYIEHALAYAGTALLARLGYPERDLRGVILALVLYAAVLEGLQHFSVGRSPAVEGWLASCFGVLVGSGAARWGSAILKRSMRGSQGR